jgi:carbonic anhydrase
MIVVQCPPYSTFRVEFQNQTVQQLIQALKDEQQLEFRPDSYLVQDTSDGHTCAPDEHVVDNRLYHLSAWIRP